MYQYSLFNLQFVRWSCPSNLTIVSCSCSFNLLLFFFFLSVYINSLKNLLLPCPPVQMAHNLQITPVNSPVPLFTWAASRTFFALSSCSSCFSLAPSFWLIACSLKRSCFLTRSDLYRVPCPSVRPYDKTVSLQSSSQHLFITKLIDYIRM